MLPVLVFKSKGFINLLRGSCDNCLFLLSYSYLSFRSIEALKYDFMFIFRSGEQHVKSGVQFPECDLCWRVVSWYRLRVVYVCTWLYVAVCNIWTMCG